MRSFQREASVRRGPILLHTFQLAAWRRNYQLAVEIPNTEPLPAPAAVPQCTGPAGGTRDTLNIMYPWC